LVSTGSQPGGIPGFSGKFGPTTGKLLNCCNIGLLADLAYVIPVIIELGLKFRAVLMPNPIQHIRQCHSLITNIMMCHCIYHKCPTLFRMHLLNWTVLERGMTFRYMMTRLHGTEGFEPLIVSISHTVTSTVFFVIIALSSFFWTTAWPYYYPYMFSGVTNLSTFYIFNLARCPIVVVLDVMFCRDELFLWIKFSVCVFCTIRYFVNIDCMSVFF